MGGQRRKSLGRLNNTEPATQSLDYSDSTVTWHRGGTGPEVWRATFDYSTDDLSWASLGAGTRIAEGWQLTGVSLPAGTTLRARGFVADGSSGVVESRATVSSALILLNLAREGTNVRLSWAGGQPPYQVQQADALGNPTAWQDLGGPVQTNSITVADIGELALQTALAALHPDNNRQWAWKVIEAIKHRAGLLLERQPQVYTFPHRTFQEYLAGAHLASQVRFAQESSKLVEKGAFWREVILLAVGKLVYLSGDVDKPLALVGELCPHTALETTQGWQRAWLAGEVLSELGLPRVKEGTLGCDLLERVQHRLAALLQVGALSPLERAKAGTVLGYLGDPRSGVGLRKDGRPDIQFVPDKPLPAGLTQQDVIHRHISIKKPYRISLYPITVAQFQAFVDDRGYEQGRFWNPEGTLWRDGRYTFEGVFESYQNKYKMWTFPIRTPERYAAVFQTPNHPQVGVSWYEAEAFCHWVSEKLECTIRLPLEAEWEQAARWNRLKGTADNRYFPWGGQKWDVSLSQKCNSKETTINHTTVVGMFPEGNAECGAADLSGNVWEWCNKADYTTSKDIGTLCGGSWGRDTAVLLSCSSRNSYHPGSRYSSVGFRVVAPAQ